MQPNFGKNVCRLVVSAGVGLAGCGGPPQAEVPPAPVSQASRSPSGPVSVAAQSRLVAELELENPSSFARSQSPTYISFYDLGLAAADPALGTLAMVAGETNLPSQPVDWDGDGSKDGLLALVDLKPAETLRLRIVVDEKRSRQSFPKLTQAEIGVKQAGEWRARKDKPELKEYVGGSFHNVQSFTPPPEHTDHSQLIRYEGPGIESDKVGYRIYLDWRNGFDIFGKRVSTPVLQKVGLDGYESYHQLADWGMDILKVGESLGVGGFGFWDGKKVQRVSQVDGWDTAIVENGNLYSAFKIKYRGWQIDGKKVDLDARFSMLGGSRAVHSELRSSEELRNLVIGVVKHPGTELIHGSMEQTGAAYTYLASWGKQSLNADLLGMAVLFRNGALATREDDGANYAAVVKPEGKSFDYYLLAAWAGEPGAIKTREEFVAYLNQEAEKLTLTPRRRLLTATSAAAHGSSVTAESALAWAKQLADSELARKTLAYRRGGWDENRHRKPKFEYDIVGLQPLAYDELNQVSPNPNYASVLETVTGSYVTDAGEILEYQADEFNLDSVNPGRNLLRLLEITKAQKYEKAAARLRKQLAKQPRTSEGAFWHKKKYPHQIWLDGVYMSLPFLAGYSRAFESGKSLDEVVNEFVVARKRLRNEQTGLYFHAWDEKKKQPWADPQTGLSKHYWGRGLGWFSMATVDVLDSIPVSDVAHRKPILQIIEELAPVLAKYQDSATGTWWQILDRPEAAGNYRESSASAMFSYFFAKAVRKGYLPAAYKQVAIKAFGGLVREFINVHADGRVSMTNQCLVAGLGMGRDGSYRYYMSEPIAENDPKGNGPFILSGVEMYRLLKGS